MINTLLYRILLAIPTMLGVAVICFMLVQIAPGDLVGVGDAAGRLGGAASDINARLTALISRCPCSLSTGCGGRRMATLVCRSPPAAGDRRSDDRGGVLLRLALLATAIGFVLGSLFGFVAGYFRNSVIDRLASVLSVFGVSVPRTTGWGCCW